MIKQFLPAIKLSLRYRWSISGAVICSLIVAVLCVASITTVFPIVESVFQKKTIATWIVEEVTDSEARITRLTGEIESIETQLNLATDANEQVNLRDEIDRRSGNIGTAHETIDFYATISPWVENYAPKTPWGTLIAAMVWLLVAAALKGIFLIIGALFVSRISNGTARDMRRIYYRKALEMDQVRFDQMGTSNILTHLSHNMMLISSGLAILYGKSIREPLKIISCLSVAAFISWPLLLISLTLMPVGAWVVHRLARGMKNATRREVLGMADIFDTLIETLSSIKTVRIFNRESTERKRFKANAEMLYRMSMRMRFYDALVQPITELLGIVSITLAILAGGWLALSSDATLFGNTLNHEPMSPAKLMLFFAMLAGASDPARKLTEIVNVLVRGGTACETLVKIYDIKPCVTAPDKPLSIPQHSEKIEFDNVVFAYQPQQLVLKNVSLTIPYGQTLAIVGENGCGKSTLVNLLARFYDPRVGRILIDGIDIRQTNPRKLRRQMAWVTQDSHLFIGSVLENIGYGLRGATQAQILNAAKLAQVDNYIDQLANGYETDIGEGGRNLSAGQRQRVALARAILADPRILILDEATSQLDGHTEQLVHESLRSFIKARTTIIITHRLSTISLADRVIVMDRGRIVSDSTPEDAVQSSKEFKHLFAKSA